MPGKFLPGAELHQQRDKVQYRLLREPGMGIVDRGRNLIGRDLRMPERHAHGWIADVELLQPIPPVNNTKAWLDKLPTIERLIGPERCFVTSPGRDGAVETVVSCPVLEVAAAERVTKTETSS